jgi:hypothetical protein
MIFDLVTLTLKFDPLFKNFNIGYIFWMASDRAFIFNMCVPYDKTFLLVPKVLTLWPWPWSLTHFSKTNIGHIFWMVSDRAFIFHMHVTCDKTFILELQILKSWPWVLTIMATYGICLVLGHLCFITHLVNFYFEEELGNYRGNLESLGLFRSYNVLKLTFLHLNYF